MFLRMLSEELVARQESAEWDVMRMRNIGVTVWSLTQYRRKQVRVEALIHQN